jgi:hypothetical protein
MPLEPCLGVGLSTILHIMVRRGLGGPAEALAHTPLQIRREEPGREHAETPSLG